MATGAVQYAFTGASYDTPVGIITGGTWLDDDKNAKKIRGVGGVGVVVPGAMLTTANLNIVPVDANALIDNAVRSSYPGGDPTSFYLHVGDDDIGRQADAWYANTFSIELEEEEVLNVGIEAVHFGKPTNTTSAESYPGSLPELPLIWLEGYVHLGVADCDARKCTINGNNNMIARYDLNEKSDGSRLFPSTHDTDAEVIDVELEMYEPSGHDLLADDFGEADVTIVAASQNVGASACTLTAAVTNCKAVGQSSSYVAEGQRIYTQRYQVNLSNGDISIDFS